MPGAKRQPAPILLVALHAVDGRRELLVPGELGHEVPAALYATVAQVLTYVYQLKAAMARGAKPPPAPVIN